MANGDDTALLELFAQHALAGGTNQFTAQPRLLFACAYVGGQRIRQARAGCAAVGRAALQWNIAGLVIAAGVALITVPDHGTRAASSGPAS
jgi:hypothetical protein